MNDFLLIFMGIFILLLIFLIFILLAYVYHTYTTYTVDINKNLETSEDAINNTSTAFNKLQDTVINELAKVNKNQETIITTIPDNLISLNSNLLGIFDISSNNNKITDITKTTIQYDSIGVLKPFTSYKNFTALTDKDNNFLTICNKQTDPSKRTCIKMNIDDSDIFNIYTKNINNSNALGINIYDTNNSILANFDTLNKKISLGSNINPAISINNNVYTSDVIVCKCTYTAAVDASSAKITLTIISNIDIGTNKVINLPIFDIFTINTQTPFNPAQAINITYLQNILKFTPVANIAKNTIANININIVISSLPSPSTTNGYITAT